MDRIGLAFSRHMQLLLAFCMFLTLSLFLACKDNQAATLSRSSSVIQNHEDGLQHRRIEMDESDANSSIAIRLFAWWWNPEEAKKGINVAKQRKNHYVEVSKWEHDGEGITTYPHKIDISIDIANRSLNQLKGTAVVTLERRFGDYERIMHGEVNGVRIADDGLSVDERIAKLPWVNKTTASKHRILIAVDKRKELKIKDFNLTGLLNERSKEDSIFGLRFSVVIFDESGVQIMKSNKVLPIILGD